MNLRGLVLTFPVTVVGRVVIFWVHGIDCMVKKGILMFLIFFNKMSWDCYYFVNQFYQSLISLHVVVSTVRVGRVIMVESFIT